MNFTRLALFVLVVSGLTASLSFAGDVTTEGRHFAHVGTPVRITLSYETVPFKQIETLKIYIDGKPLSDPEIAKSAGTPATPGHADISFIYHPEKRGQHRVELLPMMSGKDGETRITPPRVYIFFVL